MFYHSIRKISVIGVGYVGLPIAVELASNTNFKIIGFDCNESRVNQLAKGKDCNKEIALNSIRSKGELLFTFDEIEMDQSDIYIVTVPTPIDDCNRPDLSALLNAAKSIGLSIYRSSNSTDFNDKNILIIVESTVYPGVTNDLFSSKVLSEIPSEVKSKCKIEFW